MKMQNVRKAISLISFIFYLVILISVFDVLVFRKCFRFGYPRHYEEENIQRYPAPYVEFIGKPNVRDHNEYGFRGPSFKESEPEDLKIAFFGGSTGQKGNPPIPKIVEMELEKLLGVSVFVANYSVTSSNHRQHLHGIIEFLPQFKPDLVIFYGGYNETMQSAYYDPRPGYPFNYFYRSETGPLIKLLIENSAIIGEIDKKRGVLTGLAKLRTMEQPFSDDWNKRIADKYFETLRLSHDVTGSIESKRFGKTKFMAFYQPYQVPRKFMSTHDDIKKRISAVNYVFDVSSEYDAFGSGAYTDSVHVNQRANQTMGSAIARIIVKDPKIEAIRVTPESR